MERQQNNLDDGFCRGHHVGVTGQLHSYIKVNRTGGKIYYGAWCSEPMDRHIWSILQVKTLWRLVFSYLGEWANPWARSAYLTINRSSGSYKSDILQKRFCQAGLFLEPFGQEPSHLSSTPASLHVQMLCDLRTFISHIPFSPGSLYQADKAWVQKTGKV